MWPYFQVVVLCYINNNSIYIIDDINATNMISVVNTNLSVQLGDIIYDINMINMINIVKTNMSVQWGDIIDDIYMINIHAKSGG